MCAARERSECEWKNKNKRIVQKKTTMKKTFLRLVLCLVLCALIVLLIAISHISGIWLWTRPPNIINFISFDLLKNRLREQFLACWSIIMASLNSTKFLKKKICTRTSKFPTQKTITSSARKINYSAQLISMASRIIATATFVRRSARKELPILRKQIGIQSHLFNCVHKY